MKKSNEEESKIWGCFLHLSFNMWEDYISPHRPFRGFRPYLELSEPLWNDAINKMAEEGINLVAIELGDAVEYKCYPEIAVHNAWKPERLLKEVERIKSLGMEPIPALNFSAGHDTWMGEYSRMVSTDEYYKFCADIIDEICDIFGNPRFFHLGLDEESNSHQHYQSHITIRKNDAWWSDFYILIGEVMKHGARPWIWSDYMLWNEPEQFFSKMPKSVIQSNWYYGETLDANQTRVKAYLDLEAHKFDQIPTGSFHDNNFKSIGNTVKFCSDHIDDSRLMGFLQTFWKPTIEEYRDLIIQGIELLGEAKRNHLG